MLACRVTRAFAILDVSAGALLPVGSTVLIDARPLQGASATRGIGTYVRGLLGGLLDAGAVPQRLTLLLARAAIPGDVMELGLALAPRLRTVHPTLQPTVDLLQVSRVLSRMRPSV
jgi:hypothetical protein